MITFWMTEALPLPVTALVGPTLAVLLGVAPVRTVFAPFADPIIFLFIGSFILAEAMFVHRLDRRMAYSALASAWVGRSALRLVMVYASASPVCISMWMSNTATTAMLFPLGLAVLAELGRGPERDRQFEQFAMAMMLVTSFAASIGGIATPVGTPPNLIGKGFLQQAGINISFAGWMALCVPMMIVMMGFVGFWLLVPRARNITLGEDARRAVHEELRKLGPVSVGERNVIIAFVLTVAMWVVPGLLPAAPRVRPSDLAAAQHAVPGVDRGPRRRGVAVSPADRLAGPEIHARPGRRPRGSTGASSCCSAAAWRWGSWRTRPGSRRRSANG